MSDPGLDKRLRQHSRRAGLMVGVSMALTIALCIGSFVYLYAWADPLTRDFVNASAPEPTRTPTEETAQAPDNEDDAPTPTARDEVDAEPTQPPEPTATPNRFRATHVVSADLPINLRPGPAVSSGNPVATLEPGTELQYLDETEPSQDPQADGDLDWMKFRTEDGLEGWIREIDVRSLNAGQ